MASAMAAFIDTSIGVEGEDEEDKRKRLLLQVRNKDMLVVCITYEYKYQIDNTDLRFTFKRCKFMLLSLFTIN